MIIKQIRYYDEGYENDSNKISKKELNYPSDITAQKLISGEYFDEVRCREIQIRASSGTKLIINGRIVQIGDVEVYNILYDEDVLIGSLRVDADSIEYIKNDPKAYLVITFILEDTQSNDDDDDENGNNTSSENNDENNPIDGSETNQDDSGDVSPSHSVNIRIGRDNHDNTKQSEE